MIVVGISISMSINMSICISITTPHHTTLHLPPNPQCTSVHCRMSKFIVTIKVIEITSLHHFYRVCSGSDGGGGGSGGSGGSDCSEY